MSASGVKRLAVVSSSATRPHHHPAGGFLLNRVIQPLVTDTIVRASDLEWTIVRPSGLFDAPDVSAYHLFEDQAPGVLTSRADLAACLLAQASQGLDQPPVDDEVRAVDVAGSVAGEQDNEVGDLLGSREAASG
jgi:uncharacterized protein YbjT (DUF2867 family)